MRKAVMVAGVLCVALVGCGKKDAHGEGGHDAVQASVAVAGGRPTVEDIAGLFDLWNETLQSGSAHDMAALYADDGVLLPTVSNQVRNNRGEITDYFEHFLLLKPKGVINEQYIDILDEDTAVNSGVYTFDLTRDGQPAFVVARYNYVYQKVNGRWLIKSHHSSAMPEEMDGRPPVLTERQRTRRVAQAVVVSASARRQAMAAQAASGSGGDSHGGGQAAPAAASHGGGH